MSFDLQKAERAIKPQHDTSVLMPRRPNKLPFATHEAKTGRPLLLDTTVYIDVLKGSTPAKVDELLRSRQLFHSAVCLGELTHALGRLVPANPGTSQALTEIRGIIDDIPRHRIFAPDTDTWGRAGMLAGKVMRRVGALPGQGDERKLLNDSLIYLQAAKVGAAVLTRNQRDFDFLNQIVPEGGIVLY